MARKYDFAGIPVPYIPRSRQNLSHSVKTTMSVGKLYPIDWVEVLPGERIKSRDTNVSRISTAFIKPVMDNLYLDTWSFFVPYRLVFDDAERVFGNPKPSSYTSGQLATIPGTYGTVTENTVAERLGLPPGVYGENQLVQVLPARAFALIYEWFFRNQNTVDEMLIQTGPAQASEQWNNNPWAPNNYTGQLPNVPKMKDQFVAALPQPQKGPALYLPIGASAPVTIDTDADLGGMTRFPSGSALAFYLNTPVQPVKAYPVSVVGSNANNSVGQAAVPTEGSAASIPTNFVVGSNLKGTADLSQAVGLSINDQRLIWAQQRMLERDALYGSRYNSFLYGHFGVRIKDSRLQIPELLSGKRVPLNVMQVAQTAPTSLSDDDSPLANLGAYSWTTGRSRWSYYFPEHGMVITLAALRYKHTYQQGIPKKWTRFERNDFYDPLYATVGYQAIYQSELYKAPNDSVTPLREKIFAYQEAWIEYRQIPSYITGQMRSSSDTSFDVWHFADNYSSAPTLSQSFTDETPLFVDRTIYGQSDSVDTFLFDFYFDMQGILPMPKRSQPGLVDHH